MRLAVVTDLRAALTGAVPAAAPGSVVTAGPGTGKSHLLRELTASLPGTVRRACADELSWRRPFDVACTLLGVAAPDPVPEGFEDTLLDRVDEMCASDRLTLVVDDAHNADAASLEMLGRLVDAAADLPLVLLLARRQLPRRTMLEQFVARRSVREWTLPAMTDDAVTVMATEVLGAAPDAALTALLATAGGNPMHALTLLRGLQRSGELTVEQGRATTGHTDAGTALADVRDVVGTHLALLDPRATDLLRKLAVWGGPATLPDLAALDASPPVALVAAAQSAVDAGVIAISDSGQLSFTHDLYAEVVYARLAPALRSVLHEAIAGLQRTRGAHQLVAHHVLAADLDDAAGVSDAVRRAEEDLVNTPAVAVDLLDSVGDRPGAPTPGIRLGLAKALARTGQLRRASEVAAEGVGITTDIDELAMLLRIQMFTLIAQGRTAEARRLIVETLELPVGDAAERTLRDLLAYLGILEGGAAVPESPFDTATSPTGLVTEALRQFLRGEFTGCLELAMEASRLEGAAPDTDRAVTTSADIWPPLIELYANGPRAAATLLDHVTQLRTDRGTNWMTSYHEFTSGGIELIAGRLSDAAARFDAGFEHLGATEMGWTSLAQAGRALVDIHRGELGAAATRLDEYTASGLPHQFGIPTVTATHSALLEALRRLRPAATEAAAAWRRARELNLYGWMPMVVLQTTRIALRAHDDDLICDIREGISALPRPLPAAATGVLLADALCATAQGEVPPAPVTELAITAATGAREMGDRLGAASAWEEGACAAAALGDKTTAKDLGIRALSVTQEMGAVTSSTRISSRLRALGLRLDPKAVRDRPRTGWDSLTRSEVTVAELVADGLSGPEIAQRLVLSRRTVQTHVSHALTKLGLRTRVELAALVVARRHRG
ncbi:AAA family ATPase [Gordonia desulfuricans]|uniref:AAA family ATPase n=2 Tax=Gordoniaceae TaxID=85026 RepID=A0A7K3LIR6_9ACTN|nr:AAA family ATPase [Gordonia desulfuricans]